jgi:broad specificity phosphatase PhoE
MTNLLLIRHGQATYNLEGRWAGWSATPLTKEGRRQAESLAQRLSTGPHTIGHLCASPLLRTRQHFNSRVGSNATHSTSEWATRWRKSSPRIPERP